MSKSKQIDAIIAKCEKEMVRLKDIINNSLMFDNLITKLVDYSDVDLKKIGKIMASRMDNCIVQFERENTEKKVPKDEPKQKSKVDIVQNEQSAQLFTIQHHGNQRFWCLHSGVTDRERTICEIPTKVVCDEMIFIHDRINERNESSFILLRSKIDA